MTGSHLGVSLWATTVDAFVRTQRLTGEDETRGGLDDEESGGMDGVQMTRGEQLDAVTFAPLLREYRDRRRLSQSRLAEAAGFDHSYVSRLESGTRMPTRDAVSKLADAMGLDDGDRDALLASAGFMPGRIENLFASEPVLSEVLGLLQNRAVPAEVRDDVRHMISLLVRQAQRAATEPGRAGAHADSIAAA